MGQGDVDKAAGHATLGTIRLEICFLCSALAIGLDNACFLSRLLRLHTVQPSLESLAISFLSIMA